VGYNYSGLRSPTRRLSALELISLPTHYLNAAYIARTVIRDVRDSISMANNIAVYSPQAIVVHVAKKVHFVSLFSVVQVNVHLYSITALLYMFQGNKNTISS
jgi:hypothetical protein